MEQKIEYQTILDEAIKEIDSKVGDYEEARNKLIILLEQINPIIDPKTTIFSFDNIIDYTLFNNRFNSDKKYIISEYPLFKFYYYIALTYLQEKDNEETKNYLKKAIKSNPFDTVSYIQLADTYKTENELNSMLKTIIEMYKYIYTATDMKDFYITLGDYYFLTKNFELANVLYSYGDVFLKTDYVEKMLTIIGMELKRPLIFNTKNDCIKVLEDSKIKTTPPLENIIELKKMYEISKTIPEDYKFRSNLKKIIYELTFDEAYEDTMTIKNTQLEFTFRIPASWNQINRTDYNKSTTGDYTLYVIEAEKNNVINMNILKNHDRKDLIEEYKLYKDYTLSKDYIIEYEQGIRTKNLDYILMIISKKLLNEMITIIHTMFIIKDKVIDITIPTKGNYNNENIKELQNDLNLQRITKIIESIEIVN
ncbi:MAG: hypothetical protein RSE21_00265 [Bacilli bacterium]